jgi:hypothetical protein
MQTTNQEMHLWPMAPASGPLAAGALPPALRLPFGPAVLTADSTTGLALVEPALAKPSPGVLVETFFNPRQQLRLLVGFPAASTPQANGEPAPRRFVLGPGDFFQWAPGRGFHVALFNKPQLGPPPASVLGKLCPVCRVPFAADSTCVACLCGVVLHCEGDEKKGPDAEEVLRCAQERHECPVCRHPLVLTEGYVNPPGHED